MTGKELQTTESYLPAAGLGPAEWQEVLSANLGGEAPGAFDLPRIRIPAGGGLAWTVPTLDGPEPTKALTGVIVMWHTSRGYWARSFEDSGTGTPPDCSSSDGMNGVGTPGGLCARCPQNEFGSAGAGKACKEARLLYIIRPGDILPTVIALAPMSIKPCKDYFLGLAAERRVPYYAVETTITLEQAKNAGGITYSRAKFTPGRTLADDEVQRIRAYRDSLSPVLSSSVRRDEVDG